MSSPVIKSKHLQRPRLAKFWLPLVAIMMASILYHKLSGHGQPGASYLVTGSFTSSSLYVLRYDRATRKLQVVRSVPAHGPHQYLYIDRPNQKLYATSWAEPAHLSAWSIERDHPGGRHPRLTLINQAPITAVSSYITSKYGLLFSVGGPTGEVHQLNPETGAIEEKLHEILFVPKDALVNQDKSRKALRNGSHAVEISSLNQVFVPHLGHNSIWIYDLDSQTKTLEFSSEVQSPNAHDGPRHSVVSSDGQRLYVITEHTSRVDLYNVAPSGIVHHQVSLSAIEDPQEHSKYRGDTVRVLPSSLVDSSHEYIFATTRGADRSQRGQLAVFEYNSDTRTLKVLLRWETPTSGGKANAIEFSPLKLPRNVVELVLTDDDVGWVSVLECDLSHQTVTVISSCLIDQKGVGASHAVWI
ncbi:hypothetical protein PGT21_017972 [Puccinia graminis f. sp. tritici]|uniref:Muconate cycloisomerase 1 n=1 Tax=Puccinia graminis f. sp. tritici TaxID=56615 RepID=A0A5B0NNB7_PUCGR|nr:hypothetical protein PGT21_017972 [Puccinia graminis f. sp. tritici]